MSKSNTVKVYITQSAGVYIKIIDTKYKKDDFIYFQVIIDPEYVLYDVEVYKHGDHNSKYILEKVSKDLVYRFRKRKSKHDIVINVTAYKKEGEVNPLLLFIVYDVLLTKLTSFCGILSIEG